MLQGCAPIRRFGKTNDGGLSQIHGHPLVDAACRCVTLYKWRPPCLHCYLRWAAYVPVAVEACRFWESLPRRQILKEHPGCAAFGLST